MILFSAPGSTLSKLRGWLLTQPFDMALATGGAGGLVCAELTIVPRVLGTVTIVARVLGTVELEEC